MSSFHLNGTAWQGRRPVHPTRFAGNRGRSTCQRRPGPSCFPASSQRASTRQPRKPCGTRAKDGVAVGDIVRDLLVSFAGVAEPTPIRRRRIPDGAELARLLGELGRISGNLQRCYVAATNKALTFDAQEFAAIRDELRVAAAEVRALIGGPRDN